jgi:hypothetical protein
MNTYRRNHHPPLPWKLLVMPNAIIVLQTDITTEQLWELREGRKSVVYATDNCLCYLVPSLSV